MKKNLGTQKMKNKIEYHKKEIQILSNTCKLSNTSK